MFGQTAPPARLRFCGISDLTEKTAPLARFSLFPMGKTGMLIGNPVKG
jgi:hypothetical protein